jgi:hypothetical protein
MKKEQKYQVVSSTFVGTCENKDGEVYGYKYELVFNKSLGHTGRFQGIEKGLDDYCRKEPRQAVIDSFKSFWRTLIFWIKH